MANKTKSLRESRARSTVGDWGEARLVAAIQRRLKSGPGSGVIVGPGDDAAGLRIRRGALAISADSVVEEVDFRWGWATWEDVGHKAAAINLSDLAAMGATPRAMVLALHLRPGDRVADVLSLVSALDRVGKRFGSPLIGGDVSRIDGPMVAAVTVFGALGRRPLLRHRGQPGDLVAVTGTVGDAAVGLQSLEARGSGLASPASKGRRSRPVSRLLRPVPRVGLGIAWQKAGCIKSAADVSDGLARDALHLAAPSCGVALETARLPISRSAQRVHGQDRISLERLALTGGEDYELVVAITPQRWPRAQTVARKHGVRLTVVGTISERAGLFVDDRPWSGGFDHFLERA